MENIRAKLKRRLSYKDPNPHNYDEYDEADEETQAVLDREYEAAEADEKNPYGIAGSLLNKLIMHGNKKTEDQIARENASSKPTSTATSTSGATGQTATAAQTSS